MHKHLTEPLLPPDHVNTDLSLGVGEVVEVMMAKDRSRRYGSTADMLMDLEAIAEGNPPPQAGRQIDQKVLSGLTAGVPGGAPALEALGEPAAGMIPYIIILGAALALSVILNIVLLATITPMSFRKFAAVIPYDCLRVVTVMPLHRPYPS